MFYNEIYTTFKEMTGDDVKKVVISAFEYTMFGVVPEFETVVLKMVWGFIQPKLDHDGEKYKDKVLHSKHAVFCREFKKKNPGKEPLDFEEWLSYQNQMVSTDNGRYLTGTITRDLKGTITLTREGTGKREVTRGAGEEGEGNPQTVQSSQSALGFNDPVSPRMTDEEFNTKRNEWMEKLKSM
jgi:hypothetical protein